MKLLVETTGAFQLYGPGVDQFARHNRPSVVISSSFIQRGVAKGELKTLGQLSDDADDADFVASGCDVKAYLTKFAWVDPDAPRVKPAKAS